MKIFGHPLHIMLIHFPSALFPMDLLCALIGYGTDMKLFADASFCCLMGGSVFGLLALVAGTFDLLAIAQKKPSSMKAAIIHGGINSVVILFYCVIAYIAFKKYPVVDRSEVPVMILKTVLILVMIFGNYLGANLILKDKVLEEK
ncbi:MAG: DUF2231 domain-containing protein [Bacteroidia bacterium]